MLLISILTCLVMLASCLRQQILIFFLKPALLLKKTDYIVSLRLIFFMFCIIGEQHTAKRMQQSSHKYSVVHDHVNVIGFLYIGSGQELLKTRNQ